MTHFRLSAHRRLVADPRRGRLLLQLAYVADREAELLWDQHAWPPVRWDDLPEATRADVEHLHATSNALAAEAARLGVRGGIQEAFGEVFAWAAPCIEAALEREHLAWEVARALEAGAILEAGDVEAGPVDMARGGPVLFVCDRGETLLNEDRLDADAAAAAFCGERGAGEEAARAALEAWERQEEERAA